MKYQWFIRKREVKPTGYAYIEWQHFAGGRHLQAEHRAVFEAYHSRLIRPGHVIHHVDRDPSNNCPCNLQEMTQDQHVQVHVFLNALDRVQKRKRHKERSKGQ